MAKNTGPLAHSTQPTSVNHNPGALHLLFVKIVSPARRLQPLISHCRVAHNNRQCQAAAQKFAKA